MCYRQPRRRYWLLWRDALLGRDLDFHPEVTGKALVRFPDDAEHVLTFGAMPVVGEPLDAELPEGVAVPGGEWTVTLVAVSLGDSYEYSVEVEAESE